MLKIAICLDCGKENDSDAVFCGFCGGKICLYDSESLESAKQKAELGNTEAQFELGMMYSVGKLLPRDKDKAVEWLLMASVKGHRGASTVLGINRQNLTSTQNADKVIRQKKALRLIHSEEFRVTSAVLLIALGVTVIDVYNHSYITDGYFFGYLFLAGGIYMLIKPFLQALFSMMHGNVAKQNFRYRVPIGIFLLAWGAYILKVYRVGHPERFFGCAFVLGGLALVFRPLLGVVSLVWRESKTTKPSSD